MNAYPNPGDSAWMTEPGHRDSTAGRREGKLLRRILVPTDLSPSSLEAVNYACGLARAAHAAVHFVHIVEPVPRLSSLNDLPIMLSDAELAARWERLLTRLAEENATPQTPVSTEVRIGKPADEIVVIAKERDADLIVLSTHGRTGLKHVLLGSTAERVVRHSTCPVLVVRHQKGDAIPDERTSPLSIRRILAPTDFSDRAETALRYAGWFAAEFGGELIVLHCIHYEPNVVGPEYSAFDLAVLNEVSGKSAATELASLVRDSVPPQVKARTEVCVGPPLGEVPEFARTAQIDLIICSTHGRTGLPHVLVGSTAEGLVRHAPCPVLVLPQRFLEAMIVKQERMREDVVE